MTADPTGGTSTRRAWAMTATLWVTVLAVVAYEIVPASVLPLIRASLAIGPATAGWLVSSLFLGMAVWAIPAGVVLDRTDTRATILGATVVVVASMVWAWHAGRTGALASLLVARFVGGGGIVALWTASVDAVGGAFSARRQATAIGLVATATPAGFAAGQFTGPVLAAWVGWPGIFLVYAGVTVAALAAFAVVSYGMPVASTTGHTPTLDDFRAVFSNRAVWVVSALAFAAFSLNLFFNNWLPTYLVERFGVTLVQGGLFAAVFPAVGIVSRGVSGVLSDRVFGTRRRPLVLASFVATVPIVVAVAAVDVVALLLVALVLAGFFVQLGLTILFTFVRELVADNVAGTAFAVLNAVGFFGSFTAPIVTGVLIERTGAFTTAFGYAAVLALLGVVLTWTVREPGG